MTEPLLALAAGIVLGSAVLGVLDVPDIVAEHSTLHHGAEILLAISVMGVALRYPFSAIRTHWRRLALLLVLVLPGMALVSTGQAMWVLGIPTTASSVGARCASQSRCCCCAGRR